MAIKNQYLDHTIRKADILRCFIGAVEMATILFAQLTDTKKATPKGSLFYLVESGGFEFVI